MASITAEVPREYDVFISYRHADRDAAVVLRDLLRKRELRVWFDEDHIPPGELFQNKMAEGLRQSGAVAILVGPNTVAGWQEAEMQVALNYQRQFGTRVIPVLLPKVSPEGIPAFLQVHSSVNFQVRMEEEKALDRLYWGITGRKPRETKSPPPPRAANLDLQEDVNEALDKLAGQFSIRPVTLFLGARLAAGEGGQPLRSCDVAAKLLERITLLPSGRAALRSSEEVMKRFEGAKVVPIAELAEFVAELEYLERAEPVLLPPIDVAAMYYEVKQDQVDLEDQIRTFAHAERVPDVYGTAAILAKKLTEKAGSHQTRFKQLIVTTSVDLLMERALVEAGMAFTRIVQHWSEPKVSVTEFAKPPAGIRPENVLEWLSDQSDQNPKRIDPNEVLAGSLIAPVLYKFCGSVDHLGTCAISSNRLSSLARNAARGAPEALTGILKNTPLLFLGARVFDPDFRLCLDTLLAGALKTGHQRYLVAPRPLADDTDCYLRIEAPLWRNIRNKAREEGITLVEAEASEFLHRLLERS